MRSSSLVYAAVCIAALVSPALQQKFTSIVAKEFAFPEDGSGWDIAGGVAVLENGMFLETGTSGKGSPLSSPLFSSTPRGAMYNINKDSTIMLLVEVMVVHMVVIMVVVVIESSKGPLASPIKTAFTGVT
jgi:hypothetical protein